MRAINHALTGAVIGFTVGEPLLAIPLAVVSHFVLDVIPHFGMGEDDLSKRWFNYALVLDALLCFGLVLLLVVTHRNHWLLAAVCAFGAAAPDLLSINKYLQVRRGVTWRPGRYTGFASNIQWFERPIGAVVEAVWFVAVSVCLMPFLR